MMKINFNKEIGTYVVVPLRDGSFSYGRILPEYFFAFYDLRTSEIVSQFDEVQSSKILFKISVRIFDFKRWKRIGNKKLEESLREPVIQFTQSMTNYKQCFIFDTDGMEKQVTPEECIGLERAAVWEPIHVEERLLDYFEGRPNEFEVMSKVRLK